MNTILIVPCTCHRKRSEFSSLHIPPHHVHKQYFTGWSGYARFHKGWAGPVNGSSVCHGRTHVNCFGACDSLLIHFHINTKRTQRSAIATRALAEENQHHFQQKLTKAQATEPPLPQETKLLTTVELAPDACECTPSP